MMNRLLVLFLGLVSLPAAAVTSLLDAAGAPNPEYETLAMIGANCLIDNLAAIAKANELCNRYGIDTVAAGAAIAFGICGSPADPFLAGIRHCGSGLYRRDISMLLIGDGYVLVSGMDILQPPLPAQLR